VVSRTLIVPVVLAALVQVASEQPPAVNPAPDTPEVKQARQEFDDATIRLSALQRLKASYPEADVAGAQRRVDKAKRDLDALLARRPVTNSGSPLPAPGGGGIVLLGIREGRP
jgi:hypothetical protein